MGAEIAFRRLDDFFQAHELQHLTRRQGLQRRHDLQPHRLVYDGVEFAHLTPS